MQVTEGRKNQFYLLLGEGHAHTRTGGTVGSHLRWQNHTACHKIYHFYLTVKLTFLPSQIVKIDGKKKKDISATLLVTNIITNNCYLYKFSLQRVLLEAVATVILLQQNHSSNNCDDPQALDIAATRNHLYSFPVWALRMFQATYCLHCLESF